MASVSEMATSDETTMHAVPLLKLRRRGRRRDGSGAGVVPTNSLARLILLKLITAFFQIAISARWTFLIALLSTCMAQEH